MTLNEVRQKIAEEDELEERQNNITSLPGNTPLSFLSFGLELEVAQYVLQIYQILSHLLPCRKALADDVKLNPIPNPLDKISRIDRRKSLRKKLIDFCRVQAEIIPALASHIRTLSNGALDGNASQEPEEIPLLLPSDPLLNGSRLSICSTTLIELEARLREAQADEALGDLRNKLRARTYVNNYKVKNVTGQRMNIRARSWQASIDRQANVCARRYRTARAALLVLRGPGDWEQRLKLLRDDDIRAINDRVLTE